MRIMKCSWLIPLLFAVLFTQCENEPDIYLVDIPDNAFLNALVDVGVDLNGDGEISAYEAAVRTSLNINPENLSGEYSDVGDIKDLTGIEDFIYLDSLNCSFHQITTLDISNNTLLIYLNCSVNQLDSLDVSSNAGLRDLSCSQNNLSSLDVSNNTLLQYLACPDNQITELDVSQNPALGSLMVGGNQMTSLDVSNNYSLVSLNCMNIVEGSGQYSTLDVSNNPDLQFLMCLGNQLTSLDLSNNPALTFLDCSYNQLSNLNVFANRGLVEFYCSANLLTSLDISNNTSLGWVFLEDMPSLHEVCVWETPFPPDGIPLVVTENSPNIYFTTACSQ